MSPEQMIVIAAAGVIAVVIVVVGVFLTRRQENLVEVRYGQIEEDVQEIHRELDERQEEETDYRAETPVSMLEGGRKFLAPINEALSQRNFGRKWRRQLARADLKLTVAEFAVAHVVSAAGLFTAGYLIVFPGDMVMSTFAGIVGLFLPRVMVSRLINKRLIAFEDQLPDTLGLWVNALRAGYSVLQTMEAIAQDAPEPTRIEFQRVVREVQLGIDLDDALNHLHERIDSPDLDLVITAVNIQRDVGGNLAEILDTISHTIRERIKLKGEIRVLTAQGRITGYIISFLPIGLALFLNSVSPGYMGQLFEDRLCGWPMIGVGLALIGIGTAVIQKIIDIDI